MYNTHQARIGVMFVDACPGIITDDDRVKHKAFRAQVIDEMVSTERSYLKWLDMMMTAYRDAATKLPPETTGLTTTTVATLFTTLKTIHELSADFLIALEGALKKGESAVFSVCLDYRASFYAYPDYVRDYHTKILPTLEKLKANPTFVAFQEQQMKDLSCQSLECGLVLPVARVPRYALLFRAIVQKTESTSRDAETVRGVLEGFNEIARAVHDAARPVRTA